ncbi:MFS transporter [Brevibacillus ginsengisoli]|uniref:MFS transporter n=1 Tax=Brevibacillus ginsengisoli TaxID=363854 RepID=UPI003CEC1942
MNIAKRLREVANLYHAYPREAVLFILASFVNSTGSAFMWPLTTLYVHNVLHRSIGEAGFALMLQSLAGIAGQFFGGAMYLRLGAKGLIVGSLTLVATAQLLVPFTSDWVLYMVIMSIIGFLNAITMPAIQAFIGFRWKKKRRELFNVVYVGNNLGLAVGTSLAGMLAAYSFSMTFWLNSVSTFAFALFFYLFMRRIQVESTEELPVGQRPSILSDDSTWQLLSRYKLYLFLALGSAFVWFGSSVWGTGVAAYIDHEGMSIAAYSLLWTINGIVIFAGQPITSLIKHTIAKSLTAQLVASACCYTIGFAFMLVFHQNYLAFVVGMVISTFGEMLKAPTIPAFITENAGEYAPFYLGVVGGLCSVGRLFGPLLLGRMYDAGGIVPVLLVATGAMAVAVLLYKIHALLHASKDSRSTQSPAQSRNLEADSASSSG